METKLDFENDRKNRPSRGRHLGHNDLIETVGEEGGKTHNGASEGEGALNLLRSHFGVLLVKVIEAHRLEL